MAMKFLVKCPHLHTIVPIYDYGIREMKGWGHLVKKHGYSKRKTRSHFLANANIYELIRETIQSATTLVFYKYKVMLTKRFRKPVGRQKNKDLFSVTVVIGLNPKELITAFPDK